LDLNPLENICRKVALEVVKRHPTIQHELSSRSSSPGIAESTTTTSSNYPLNTDTMQISNDEQGLVQIIILIHQGNAKTASSRALRDRKGL